MGRTYTFPRRFDLKTLFANFTAWSILMALLGAFNFSPTTILIISSYLVVVAAAQFVFYSLDRPRTVSMAAGAILTLFLPAVLGSPSLPIVSLVIEGSVMGYLAGLGIGTVSMVTEFIIAVLTRLFGGSRKCLEEIPEAESPDRGV